MRKYVRVLIAVFGIAFAVLVALQFKRRPPAPAPTSVARMDPRSVVESTRGTIDRFTSSRPDVRVEFDRQATYPDGSIKLSGVKIVSDERGSGKRSFKVTAKEGNAKARGDRKQ